MASLRSTPVPRPPGTALALLELASTAHGDWGASIRQLIQFQTEGLRVERVTFWSLGDGGSSIHCDAGYVATSRAFERGATLLEVDHPAYFDAIRAGRVLSVEDVTADPRTQDLGAYCGIRGIASLLNVPVWVDGRLAGVLCHEHVGGNRRWTLAEEELAQGAGNVVACALAARARTQAEVAARRAAFLDDVTRITVPSLDAAAIATRVIGRIVPRMADFVMVWTLNDRGVLEVLASTHADPRMRVRVAELAAAGVTDAKPAGLTYVVHHRQSLLYADVSASSLDRIGVPASRRALLLALGVRTMMAAPLAVPGTSFGAIAFFATSRHFDNEDLALAEDVAHRVASAFENARLYGMARQAIRARDDFLVLAAHELRTPLTSLQLLADDMLKRCLREDVLVGGDARPGGDDRARDLSGETLRCESMVRQVRRLGALVERMLDAGRIRAEGVALDRVSCDLGPIVRACVGRASEYARRAGCSIAVSVEASVVGQWDRSRMTQLVDALLDNAIKFGAARPIDVRLEHADERALLTVRDRGPGIAPDPMPSIFSPFERAVAKEHFGGLGLGLYIARTIVEAHGGSIEVSSELGQGATFTVRLPLGS